MSVTSGSFPAARSPVLFDGKLFSIADLDSLPKEVPSGPVDYELDNGRLLTRVPSGDSHGAVQAKISSEFIIQGQRRNLGLARGEVGIILWRNPDRLVGADAAFILSRSLPIRRSKEGYLETIPEIVVEVRSKNDWAPYVDRKVADYLQAGVQLVIVADQSTKSVVTHRAGGASQSFAENEFLTLGELLPDFRMSVADLFND
jgi:Uma2 family endonuclease